MICHFLRVLDEFHFHLKWYQSKWTRGTQPLSCPALFNLKSGREELQGKVSRKSDTDKIVFNQSHRNGQKIHAWKPKAYSNKKHLAKKIHTFRQLLPIITNMFQISYQTILILSWSYSQTILHTFPDIRQYWHFQRVTGKQYYTLFQSLYQAILTFSESSSQIKL